MNYRDLVDTNRKTIHRRIFWDKEIYDREQERIFARAWLFVAHESQLAGSGSFLTTYMGSDAVIVSRTKEGGISVMLNSCPHRGNRICFADAGTTRSFVCNYHGWAFGLDGDLNGMPEAELYEASPGFDKRNWGLRKARVSNYKGLIFATFDPDAPSLDEFLGDFRWYLDAVLDAEEGGTEFLPGVTRSRLKCNWKFMADNFVGDIYHALWTHLGGVEPTLGEHGGVQIDNHNSFQVSVNGHGWEFGQNVFGNAATIGDREIIRYMKSRIDVITERIGKVRANMWGAVSSALVFPNFAFLPGYFTFRTFQPKGPLETELCAWTLVPKNMPEDIKDRLRRGTMRTFSPAGMLEMDDGENWENCSSVNAGFVTRNQSLCYGLQPNPELAAAEIDLPGHVRRGQLSDANQMLFYARWAEFMMADNWSDISIDPPSTPEMHQQAGEL